MKKQNARIALFFSLIVIAMFSRLIPHAPNFTAVGAAAIFGGYIFKDSFKAFLAPLVAMFLSDLFINNVIYAEYQAGFSFFSEGVIFIYGAIVLSALLGRAAVSDNHKALKIAGAGVSSALLFYLITNFGAWLGNPMYAQNLGGLLQSYVAGLPFLANTAASTLLFSAVLFGAAYLAAPKRSLALVRA